MSANKNPVQKESIWKYPRPPRLEDSSKHIQVIFKGSVIADSRNTKRILETSHPPVYYIPPQDIRQEFLRPSERRTFCEWKGSASYYDLEVAGEVVQHAAWFYPNPSPSYVELRGFVAFYPAKMDQCLVDGETVQPERGDFYGGWVTSEIEVER
jgi:uncharacterized protein (DUF427 family)